VPGLTTKPITSRTNPIRTQMADEGGTVAAVILGLIGAAAAIAIAASLTNPRCPVCNQPIPRGANPCPRCGSYITWRQ
jgi:hypothetical protein